MMSRHELKFWQPSLDPKRRAELAERAGELDLAAHHRIVVAGKRRTPEQVASGVYTDPVPHTRKPKNKPKIEHSGGKQYVFVRDAAAELDCGHSVISEAVRRQSWSHGFRWRRIGEAWRSELVRGRRGRPVRNMTTGVEYQSARQAALSRYPDAIEPALTKIGMGIARAARAGAEYDGVLWGRPVRKVTQVATGVNPESIP
jgi:hypothetical protein